MKYRIISCLLCIALMFSMCACAKESVGCFIYYPVYDKMVSLDPQIASTDTEKLIVANCFEGLVRMDEKGEITPAAAKTWNISPDGLTYTFYLRTDAKWQLTDYTRKSMEDLLPADFAPAVTADDFVFALQRAIDPATQASDAYLLYSITNAQRIHKGEADISTLGVRAVSDYQLEITLQEPQSNFLQVLTECICMPCNRTFFEACGGRYGLMVKSFMSNGPFYLYMFSDTDYTLNASDTYNGPHKPTPAKVYLYYNEAGNNVPEKMSDEIYSAAYLTDSMLAATKTKNSSTVTELENTMIGLVFNLNHEQLQNANVRKAIAYATDTVALAQMADKPYTDSLLPSVCGYAPACVDAYDEENAVDFLLKGFEELSQPKIIEVPVQMPNEAGTTESELTDETQILTDNSELTVPTEIQIVEVEKVESVSLTILTSEEYADLIKRQMQKWQRILGLRCIIRIETVSDHQLRTRVEKGEYELAFCPLSVNSPDALRFLQSFSANNPNNCIFLSDETYENLLNKAKAETDQTAQREYIREAADYLQTNACILPVFSESSYLVQTTGVSGVYCCSGPDRVYFSNAYSEN